MRRTEEGLIATVLAPSGLRFADDRAAPGGKPPAAAPVRDAFRTQWRMILQVIGLNAAGAVAYYMCFVYVTTYLRQIDFIAASKALDINTIALLALLVMIVPIGILSDHVGRKPVLLASTGGLFVLALPLSSQALPSGRAASTRSIPLPRGRQSRSQP
jgi:MHS family proline/betaine transporter-like MFS transporter